MRSIAWLNTDPYLILRHHSKKFEFQTIFHRTLRLFFFYQVAVSPSWLTIASSSHWFIFFIFLLRPLPWPLTHCINIEHLKIISNPFRVVVWRDQLIGYNIENTALDTMSWIVPTKGDYINIIDCFNCHRQSAFRWVEMECSTFTHVLVYIHNSKQLSIQIIHS